MAISKFWSDVLGEIVGVWGGLVALQSLLIIKKGNGSFNFLSNKLFLKFLRQQMAISKFLSDAFLENASFFFFLGGVSTLWSPWY